MKKLMVLSLTFLLAGCYVNVDEIEGMCEKKTVTYYSTCDTTIDGANRCSSIPLSNKSICVVAEKKGW